MSFILNLVVKIMGTPYVVGALVRQGTVIAAAVLVSIGVLDPSLVDQWVNVNVPVVIGVILYLLQLGMSLKEKIEYSKEVNKLQAELLQYKQNS